jgi:tetratricopeptide (TPR) repeat protein
VALAATHHNLGQLFAENREEAAAEKEYQTALEIREELAAKHPGLSGYRADVARTLLSLGTLLHGKSPERSRAYYDRARALCEALVRDNHDVVEYKVDLARTLDNIGVSLPKPERLDEAVKLHREAIDVFEKLAKEQHQVVEYRFHLAGACMNLGQTLRDGERHTEALPWFARTLSELREVEKINPRQRELRPLQFKALLGRGETYVKLGKGPEALRDLDGALKLLTRTDPDYDMVRRSRAFALAQAGDHRQAVREVNDLERSKDEKKGELFYNLACVASLSAKAASEDRSLDEPTRRKLIDEYAGKAIDLLTKAQHEKFMADSSLVEQVTKDGDFDFIRKRPDFEEFMKQLAPKKKGPG